MGRTRRRRTELEDDSWESSDEEFVVEEEGEWDGDSVSGDESCDCGLGMSLFGNRESQAVQWNSCGVSGGWEEEEDKKEQTCLESKQRGGFAWRRKRSCRKSKVSRFFGGKDGRVREVESSKNWNVSQEKHRNLEAEGLCGVIRIGNMVPAASQLKSMKEFLGQWKSSSVESSRSTRFSYEEDEDGREPIAQSKALKNSSVRRDSWAAPSPHSDRVSDDDDEYFTSDAEEHVQNQEEKKDGKSKKTRRATANSNSHSTEQISSHGEDMGSEETEDSTSLRNRLSKRLLVDVSWNHLRQKRSARQSHSVHTVSDYEAFKLNEDGRVDFVGRHWGRKRKRVQLQLSACTGAVGSSDGIGVENEALTAEQKKRGRRKRKIILYSDSESEDSWPSNTAIRAMVLQEDEDLSKEANGCQNFTTFLGSPVSSRLQVGPSWSSLGRKRFRKKGTRRAAAGVQVCGICLSEEHNDLVRGMLDSCSHYFCFACIMEWSKVESRCPVCKQRFMTITKPARWDVGVCPMKEVTTIPERNQVSTCFHIPSQLTVIMTASSGVLNQTA